MLFNSDHPDLLCLFKKNAFGLNEIPSLFDISRNDINDILYGYVGNKELALNRLEALRIMHNDPQYRNFYEDITKVIIVLCAFQKKVVEHILLNIDNFSKIINHPAFIRRICEHNDLVDMVLEDDELGKKFSEENLGQLQVNQELNKCF